MRELRSVCMHTNWVWHFDPLLGNPLFVQQASGVLENSTVYVVQQASGVPENRAAAMCAEVIQGAIRKGWIEQDSIT